MAHPARFEGNFPNRRCQTGVVDPAVALEGTETIEIAEPASQFATGANMFGPSDKARPKTSIASIVAFIVHNVLYVRS